MTNQKGFSQLTATIIVIVVLLAGGAAIYFFVVDNDKPANTNTATVTPTTNVNTAVNTNIVADETAIWPRYTNDFLGFSFLYPPDTEVKWYPEASLAGAVRVVAKANPNKDRGMYTDGVGPGSIGIVSYQAEQDLLEFATSMANGLTPQPMRMLGVQAYRVQGTHDANKTRVLGAQESIVDYYFLIYNSALWGLEFDAKTKFVDQTPSHDQFAQLVESFDFTVPDRGIWPTHENEAHGFTFDYPTDWQVTDCGTEYTAVYMGTETAPTCFAGGTTRTAFKIFPEETTTTMMIDNVTDMLNISERTSVTVYGQPATKIVGTYKSGLEGPVPTAGTEAAFVFFDYNNDRFEISYHGLDGTSSLSTFTKIISSVLFY